LAIEQWAFPNGLSFNASKTQVLLCGSPHKLIIAKRSLTERFFLNGAELTFSEVVKNLSVLFDESLSGKNQVNHVIIIRQVYLRLRQLYHFSRLLSSSIKIKLVKYLIFPIFDYAYSVFCELSAGLESKLTKALNNSIRFIYNLGRFSEISLFFTMAEYATNRALWPFFSEMLPHLLIHLLGSQGAFFSWAAFHRSPYIFLMLSR
jgi:hypothetical protein